MHIVVIILIFLTVTGVSIGGFIFVNNYLKNDGSPLSAEEATTFSNKTGNYIINSDSNSKSLDNNIDKLEDIGQNFDELGEGGATAESISVPTQPVVCIDKYIQYSLKNFKEETQCLENSGGKCINFEAICSVDLHNLDVNVTENFEIEYSLIDSTDKKIDSIIISNNVKIASPKTFKANFTLINLAGVDYLSTCEVKMKIIPTKQICA